MVKPGAWLINVARGRLVDERALLRALRDGPLGGAVLDTFRDEPLPPMSSFYDLPNVIVTPHTAWSSGRVLDRSVELFCDNLQRLRDRRAAAQRGGSGRRVLTAAGPPTPHGPAAGTHRADADRHRRSCRDRQDDCLQHADPGPRRDRRLWRGELHVGCQGPRRRLDRLAAILAREGHPGRRHLRRPAGPARVDGRPCRDGGSSGGAPRRLRDSEALLHVVRAFEDPVIRTPRRVDPARDLDRLDTEFLLADLALVERRSSG